MNLILESTDQVKFFTNMKEVFSALGNICEDYDWYISDIEANLYVEDVFDDSDKWMSGKELNDLVSNYEIQFIWAVFSAFKIGERPIIKDSPYVYDNPRYWNGVETTPQIDSAEFEIACWDSSATILVGVNDALSARFCSKYSDAVSLVSVAREKS